MVLPQTVQRILRRLQDMGFEAYAVGGCIRDALRGCTPHDWDICTAATPKDIHRCFSDVRTVDTGVAHGTVTVIWEGKPYEVTTFRHDGAYSDHRHPEEVRFVRNLPEDLARRDFTINAMAVGLDGKVHDPYGGQEDLARGVVRCVGDPSARFQEDALRILRALRFAAQLDFVIDPATAQAAREQKELLKYVSGERIYAEMNKLLVGPGAVRVLGEYVDIFGVILPEILPSVGFEQHNPCHYEDVWTHTLTAMSFSGPDRLIRWALLLHDLGKPATFTLDEKGTGHFKGHPIVSRQYAEDIFRRLHADRDTQERVCRLVYYHDATLPETQAGILRWIREFGEEDIRRLVEVRRCDGAAHTDHPKMAVVRASTQRFSEEVERLITSGLPRDVKDLKISGTDLMELGVPEGREMGRILNELLEAVMDGQCENTQEALKAYYSERIRPREKL